jgi:hypothetical protein
VTAPQRGNQRCVLGPPLGASDALHPPDQALAASVNLLRDNDREVGNGAAHRRSLDHVVCSANRHRADGRFFKDRLRIE